MSNPMVYLENSVESEALYCCDSFATSGVCGLRSGRHLFLRFGHICKKKTLAASITLSCLYNLERLAVGG